MQAASPTSDDVGRIAEVRQRRYLVDEVLPGTTVNSTRVQLSCIDPDNLGRSLEVIWEKELDARLLSSEQWSLLGQRGFDPPDRFAAYYHTLRWNRLTASRTDLFQAPFRAGISIEHYQLEPLRMALAMPRVNLFVADGVGLGKTIEAGLVARELLIRRKVSDIVVCCPPSMLLQWKEEMESRFGLVFQIIDRAYVHKIRKERGFSVNPWSTHNRFLISHNLIKEEEYAADLRDWLGRDLVRPRSLFILDEAHHAAPASAGAYAITSQFTRRIKELAPKFEHKIFLSATPHNGHSNSFSMLMAILDPQRFCPGTPVPPWLRDQVLIYRLKDDLSNLQIAFPKRIVEPIRIDAPQKGTPELELATQLDEYCTLREERLKHAPTRVRSASAFLKSGLQQRLLSSVEAFWRTLLKHKQTTEQAQALLHAQLQAAKAELNEAALLAIGAGADSDAETDLEPEPNTETTPADLQDTAAQRQTELATLATIASTDQPQFAQELQRLNAMLSQAEMARHKPDEKIKKLLEYIDQTMLEPAQGNRPRGWNNHRILIFTEYDDTLAYIRRQLESHLTQTNQPERRLAIFHGGTSLEERREIQESFNADPYEHPVRILLATDAAREGLNLQKACFNLFHYDVPWNPARLEQRNGRIDRKLQPSKEVYCRYFLYDHREEDTILQRLVEKTEVIYRQLGGFPTVLDKEIVENLRRKGIERARVRETVQMFDFSSPEDDLLAAQAAQELSGDDEPDEPTSPEPAAPSTLEVIRQKTDQRRRNKVERNVEKLRTMMEESRQWLDFREAQFRAAIDCSLRLMDIEGGLAPEPTERPKARRYMFPTAPLEKNPTWRETLNSLRSPRRKGEEISTWYNRCPIRPIVFEDPGLAQLGAPTKNGNQPATLEPVHMHLEHRISQRLLGRFQAQGFMYHDLSRACLTQTAGSTPLVYLLGRLCLYGHQATRLHEDIVVVCAEWNPPEQRGKASLRPIDPKTMSEDEWMRRLDDALLAANTARITEARKTTLLNTAAQDVAELQKHLAKKAHNLETKVRAELTRAGETEATNLITLLDKQAERIEEELQKRSRQEAADRKKAEEKARKDGPTLFDTGNKASTLDDRIRREQTLEIREMKKRLEQIPHEKANEPQRIRERFSVQTVRLEPLGLVYLWPEMG